MGQYSRIVNTSPPKGREGKLVNIIPRKLLSEKVITSRQAKNLRELSRIALHKKSQVNHEFVCSIVITLTKRIRQPENFSSFSKVFFKEALANQKQCQFKVSF